MICLTYFVVMHSLEKNNRLLLKLEKKDMSNIL